MARRKNTKRIDPRYFMDEKTEIIKEAKNPWGTKKDGSPEHHMGSGEPDGRGAHDHRHRDSDGKPIGKNVDVFGRVVKDDDEPEDVTNEGDSFSGRSSISNSIRDAIIGHLENEKSFEMGAMPQSVIRAIENSALRIADTVERAKREEYDPADSPYTRPKAARYR